MTNKESNETLLARIDERVKNISDKMTIHMVSFEEHKIDDNKKFDGLNQKVWIGVGIIGTIQFISMFIHR